MRNTQVHGDGTSPMSPQPLPVHRDGTSPMSPQPLPSPALLIVSRSSSRKPKEFPSRGWNNQETVLT